MPRLKPYIAASVIREYCDQLDKRALALHTMGETVASDHVRKTIIELGKFITAAKVAAAEQSLALAEAEAKARPAARRAVMQLMATLPPEKSRARESHLNAILTVVKAENLAITDFPGLLEIRDEYALSPP